MYMCSCKSACVHMCLRKLSHLSVCGIICVCMHVTFKGLFRKEMLFHRGNRIS